MTPALSIGIDLGERGVTVAIREGRDRRQSVRVVSSEPGHTADAPGTVGARPDFWQTRMAELRAYLGGYPLGSVALTVTLAAGREGQFGIDIRQAARKAGFATPELINRVDAVAARWMFESEPDTLPTTVTVLYVGGDAIESGRFAIERGKPWSCLAPRDTPAAIACAANDALVVHVTRLVRDILPGAPREHEAALLRDAAYELGFALRSLPEHERYPWQGPLAGRLRVPLAISPHEASAWLPARELSRAIERVLGLPGSGKMPVVIGGIGAPWPVVAEVVRQIRIGSTPWMAANPGADGAIGAALWTLVSSPRRREAAVPGERAPAPTSAPIHHPAPKPATADAKPIPKPTPHLKPPSER